MKDIIKMILKRCITAFCISSTVSMLCLLIVECILNKSGVDAVPVSPEFMAKFPTPTIAYGVDIVIYGLIGVVFSGMSFVHEIDRLGIVLQNVIYFIGTTVFWLPLVLFIWQLQKYPPALFYTIGGFLLAEVITTIVGLKKARKSVDMINEALTINEEA